MSALGFIAFLYGVTISIQFLASLHWWESGLVIVAFSAIILTLAKIEQSKFGDRLL